MGGMLVGGRVLFIKGGKDAGKGKGGLEALAVSLAIKAAFAAKFSVKWGRGFGLGGSNPSNLCSIISLSQLLSDS